MRSHGHHVYIEHNVGVASGFDDAISEATGAEILATPAEVYATSDMIYKVKEPLESEYDLVKSWLNCPGLFGFQQTDFIERTGTPDRPPNYIPFV
jgi:alanine dehydrogenase